MNNDTAAIMEMAIVLYGLIQLVLLYLFIRMTTDIHAIRKKWVNQVKFTNNKIKLDD